MYNTDLHRMLVASEMLTARCRQSVCR